MNTQPRTIPTHHLLCYPQALQLAAVCELAAPFPFQPCQPFVPAQTYELDDATLSGLSLTATGGVGAIVGTDCGGADCGIDCGGAD